LFFVLSDPTHLKLAFKALRMWATEQPLHHSLTPAEREFMARRRIETAFEDFNAPSPFQRLYRDVFACQMAAATALRKDLKAIGVPSRLYKGAAVVEQMLGGEPFSVMRDVDLVVPPDCAAKARAVLRHHGFHQSDFDLETRSLRDTDARRVAAYEAASYELYAFSRIERVALPSALADCPQLWQRAPIWHDGDSVLVLVTVDVHVRAAEDIPAEYLWRGTKEHSFIDRSVEAWLLATRYYLDLVRQKKRPILRDLFYLTQLLPQVDIGQCLELADRHDTLPAFYYTYNFLQAAGMPVDPLPPDILLKGNRKNDFGWQYGKLTGTLDASPSLAA
jgi:hypothetical protein